MVFEVDVVLHKGEQRERPCWGATACGGRSDSGEVGGQE